MLNIKYFKLIGVLSLACANNLFGAAPKADSIFLSLKTTSAKTTSATGEDFPPISSPLAQPSPTRELDEQAPAIYVTSTALPASVIVTAKAIPTSH